MGAAVQAGGEEEAPPLKSGPQISEIPRPELDLPESSRAARTWYRTFSRRCPESPAPPCVVSQAQTVATGKVDVKSEPVGPLR